MKTRNERLVEFVMAWLAIIGVGVLGITVLRFFQWFWRFTS